MKLLYSTEWVVFIKVKERKWYSEKKQIVAIGNLLMRFFYIDFAIEDSSGIINYKSIPKCKNAMWLHKRNEAFFFLQYFKKVIIWLIVKILFILLEYSFLSLFLSLSVSLYISRSFHSFVRTLHSICCLVHCNSFAPSRYFLSNKLFLTLFL